MSESLPSTGRRAAESDSASPEAQRSGIRIPVDAASEGPSSDKRPTCCVCLELPKDPVRLPCRCATVMCLACFETFAEKFSACLVCRVRIGTRTRKTSVKVDPELAALSAYFQEEESKLKESTEDSPRTVALRMRMNAVAPEPGELAEAAARLVAQHKRERDEENERSEAFIKRLKCSGDEDLLHLEQLKSDEELAKKLFTELQGEGARTLDVGAANAASKITPAPPQTLQKPNTWICSKCTTVNERIWLRCQTCFSIKS